MPSDELASMSDEAVLQMLGARLERYRLNRDESQEEVGEATGLSRRSVYKVEKGQIVTLPVFIRLLRAYGLLDRLDELVPEPAVSPVALLETAGKTRRRASGAHKKARDRQGTAEGGWTWQDEP
jgi:transcriptional regulator with XRE-family HTH domain